MEFLYLLGMEPDPNASHLIKHSQIEVSNALEQIKKAQVLKAIAKSFIYIKMVLIYTMTSLNAHFSGVKCKRIAMLKGKAQTILFDIRRLWS